MQTKAYYQYLSSWTQMTVTEIGYPKPKVDEIEYTATDATSKSFRSSKLVESGDLTFKFQYLKSDRATPTRSQLEFLITRQAAGDELTWAVAFEDDDEWYTFAGFVKEVDSGMGKPAEGTEISVTVRVNGAITVTSTDPTS